MKSRRAILRSREGYVLLAVTVFAIVLVIAGFGFFALASHETRQAIYRESSSEAFYLADGAVERARAKFLRDRSWRAGWSGVAAGTGTYDLSVADTAYLAYPNAVHLVATGHVRNADRRIDVIADVPPTGLGLPLLVMGDASIGGNLCIDGAVHVNGNAYGNNPGQDPNFAPGCGQEYTEGFAIYPPYIYTDPAHFPNATYYYVKGNKKGSVYQARIYDRFMVDITTSRGDSLTSVTTYSGGTFTYTFNNDTKINNYFNETTGVFRKNAGDVAVVVNFGEPPIVNPPGANGVSALVFDGTTNALIRSTVINARFVGTTEAQRLDDAYWRGAIMTVKQIKFEPRYGIACIAYDFQKQGGSQVWMGTAAWPALVYVTRNAVTVNSNFNLVGSLICLNNWSSTGGPNLTYSAGFIPNLPDYLRNGWPSGVSGTLKILRWREVASS